MKRNVLEIARGIRNRAHLLQGLPVVICGLGIAVAAAGEESPMSPSREPAPAFVQRFDFGLTLSAIGGGFKNIVGTVTVPADWPHQQRVRTLQQELPPGATVAFRTIEDVGRQMVVKIPALAAGSTVRAVVTFEVQRFSPAGPFPDAKGLSAPNPRTLERKVAVHLQPSPKIESDSAAVRQAAQEAVGDCHGAWEKVQSIHRWVHTHIAFTGDLENVQTCPQTLAAGRGVCAEMNSLAVAMLRANDFPARLVRIPGHCYYEVYLADAEGAGHWLAGDASAFAAIVPGQAIAGLILQKGDNVTIVDPASKRRVKGRFLAETVTGLPLSPGAQLHFQPITPAMSRFDAGQHRR